MEVQAAARRFLTDVLANVHRVNVVRVAPSDRRGAAWEAVAVVWQPNAAIKASGWKRNGPCSTKTATSSAWTSGWK